MSDFDKIVGQVSTVAAQVAQVINVFKGPQAPMPGQYPGQVPGQVPVYQMPRDQATWNPGVVPMTQAPVAYQQPVPLPVGQPGQPAQGGFMQALSSFFSKIANWFKGLFGAKTATTAGTLPVSTLPGQVPQNDARALLFQMFPAGTGKALGLWPVTVAKYQDRILVDVPGLMKAAILNYQGQYFFYDNDKAPVRVANVQATRGMQGETNFAIALENGKTVNAAILADGRTIRYENYQLTMN